MIRIIVLILNILATISGIGIVVAFLGLLMAPTIGAQRDCMSLLIPSLGTFLVTFISGRVINSF